MVSLSPASSDPKDVLRHVYLCLGKESIAYQELVFFMAFDLKLYAPSTCEKFIAQGKKQELLDISADRIVTFSQQRLFQKSTGKAPPAIEDILSEMTEESMINKGFAIKDDRIVVFSFDAKNSLLSARFKSESGKPVEILVNGGEKTIHQDHDDDVAAYKGKRLILKYLFKILVKKKEDPEIAQFLRQIHASLKDWKFDYKKVE
nr:DUF2240 family protein [Candidatus Sigynarchaeota archaeon]